MKSTEEKQKIIFVFVIINFVNKKMEGGNGDDLYDQKMLCSIMGGQRHWVADRNESNKILMKV